MATKVKTGVIDSGAITSALITDASITADDLHTTLDLTGKTVTVATASASDNDTSVASTAYVTTAIANLADSAPSTLNTLNELAAALGDDANFSTTVTNSIATKLPLSGGTMTGALIGTSATFSPSSGKTFVIASDSGDGPYIGTSGNQSLRIITNNTTRITLLAAGGVGIGEALPDLPLHVSGTVALPATSGSTPTGFISLRAKTAGASHGLHMGVSNASPWGSWLQAQDANNLATEYPLLLNPNGGNVGIGTTGPAHKLSVTDTRSGFHFPVAIGGGTHLAGSGVGVAFDPEGYQAEGYVHNALVIAGAGYGYNRGDFHFLMNHTAADNQTTNLTHSRLVIKSDTGNVGIGTTSPSANLDIVGGGSSVAPTLELNSVTSTSFNHAINAFNANLTAGEGNLLVVGKAGATKESGWVGYKWNGTGSDNNIVSLGHWGNNWILNVKGNGNVGIGVESPDNNLHVKGTTSIIRVQSTSANANASVWFNSMVGTSQSDRWEVGTNISVGAHFEVYDRLHSASRLQIEDGTGSPLIITASGDVTASGDLYSTGGASKIGGTSTVFTSSSFLLTATAQTVVPRSAITGLPTGTYLMTIYMIAGGWYSSTVTGIVQHYAGTTNSSSTGGPNTIHLTSAGHAQNAGTLYARYQTFLGNANNHGVQIWTSSQTTTPITIKWKRLA